MEIANLVDAPGKEHASNGEGDQSREAQTERSARATARGAVYNARKDWIRVEKRKAEPNGLLILSGGKLKLSKCTMMSSGDTWGLFRKQLIKSKILKT